MSVGSKGSSLVAHVEDAADEDAEEGIMSTRKYATSVAQQFKERPNTSRSRADRRPAQAAAVVTDSDSTARPSDRKARDGRRQSGLRDALGADGHGGHGRRDKTPRDEARPQRTRTEKDRESSRPPQRKQRPAAPKHASSHPVVQQGAYAKPCADDPAYYGVKQTVHAALRPRAQSYYGGHHGQPPPPLGPSSWYSGHHMPSSVPMGSFPPPVWSGMPPQHAYGPRMPHSPGAPPPGYLDLFASSPTRHSHLRSRFESRAPSPMGFRPPPAVHDSRSDDYGHDGLGMPFGGAPRTNDSARMPPPPFIPPKRPQSAVPQASSFRPPASVRHASRQTHSRPPPLHRKSVNYDDVPHFDDDGHDDSLDEDGQSLFNDNSPSPCMHGPRVASRPRRGSLMYSHPDCDLMPATGRGRRSSLYSSSPLATGDGRLGESKLDAAIKYQEDAAAAGANKVPLTAEALRKAMKRRGVASSRSTRSSDSPDDSEYKRSNTTGITQASHDDEYTIRVPGNAVVRLQGAEIECPNEGGEISWSMRRSASRPGSDRASSMYQSHVEESRRIEDGRRSDDSAGRNERQALPHRPRAPSQSDSQSRGGYGAAYAPYERYGYM